MLYCLYALQHLLWWKYYHYIYSNNENKILNRKIHYKMKRLFSLRSCKSMEIWDNRRKIVICNHWKWLLLVWISIDSMKPLQLCQDFLIFTGLFPSTLYYIKQAPSFDEYYFRPLNGRHVAVINPDSLLSNGYQVFTVILEMQNVYHAPEAKRYTIT